MQPSISPIFSMEVMDESKAVTLIAGRGAFKGLEFLKSMT
jgi:hypothetical protein